MNEIVLSQYRKRVDGWMPNNRQALRQVVRTKIGSRVPSCRRYDFANPVTFSEGSDSFDVMNRITLKILHRWEEYRCPRNLECTTARLIKFRILNCLLQVSLFGGSDGVVMGRWPAAAAFASTMIDSAHYLIELEEQK